MDTSRRWLSTLAPHALVACNVYVSAGRSHHGDLLLKVLTEAQVRNVEEITAWKNYRMNY